MIDFNNYKRLTEKTIGCFQYDLKDFNHKIGEFSNYDAFFAYSMAVKRLGELEDKIEAGTLVELGYHIRKSYRNHDDQRYKIILIDEVEIDKIGYDGLTKEKAERKLAELKELQEEQK